MVDRDRRTSHLLMVPIWRSIERIPMILVAVDGILSTGTCHGMHAG
jgi:hypothetical protein